MQKRAGSAAPVASENSGKPPLAETGTALAINNDTISGMPFPPHEPSWAGRASGASARNSGGVIVHHAEPYRLGSLVTALVDMLASARTEGDPPAIAKPSWGGARLKRERTSHAVTHSQAVNIIEAAQFAVALGLPLNRHITIHMEKAGVPDCEAAAAIGRYVKLVADWIAKRGGRFAWVWVRENGAGKGSHVHVLAHIPPSIPFGRMHRRWLKNITGRPYVTGTVKTTRIGGTLAAAQAATETYRVNLGEVLAYILKGVSPATGAALGLDKVEPGGRIIGKRCGTSQSIGRAARRPA